MFKEHDGSLNKPKDLKGRFCYRPFQTMEIHAEYKAFACCPAWLPKIIGDTKKDGLEKVWHSKAAKDIRDSIRDGSFRYCDHLECPEIQQGTLPMADELPPGQHRLFYQSERNMPKLPNEIALCYDASCNLACPSCRSDKILDIRGNTFEEKYKFTQELIDTINHPENANHPLILRVTGSGDPFAAPVYFKLLQELNGEQMPNLEIVLQTNGVLLTPQNWDRLKNIHKNVVAISVSIDAAHPETYTQVRKLGNWEKLQKNLAFINEIVAEHNMDHYCLNFVVQKANFGEMGDFVRMALQHSRINEVFFSFVNDWDTWTKEEYEEQCIWKTYHPDFEDFMEALRDPVLDHPIVKLGILTDYRENALKKAKSPQVEA